MKGIKTILGVLALAGLFTVNASAQQISKVSYPQAETYENGNVDENGKVVRGPYLTNAFKDNWFLGVGVGYNAAIRDITPLDLAGMGGLAVDAYLGKMITPSFGVRAGWKGISTANGGAFGSMDQHYVHADAMWDMITTFKGYKETRFWNIMPYATTGVNIVGKTSATSKKKAIDLEYAAGGGLFNTFRLGDRVDLTLDLMGLVAHERQYGGPGRFYFPVSATLGLAINLGKSGFSRHSSALPVIVPLSFTEADYNNLKNKVNQLEAENKSLRAEVESLKNAHQDTVYIVKGGDIESASRTFFNINSAEINAREKAHLDFFAKNVIANAADDKVFDVIGTADSATGSKAFNDKLALDRAKAVANYLTKNCGVDASKLNVIGKGGVADYKPASLNRAVEIR